MKVTFIHTGDIHLGRQFHFFDGKGEIGNNKRTDLWNTFEKILNTAEKNKIHFLLISGDFFDSDEIDIATLKRVAQRFGGLSMTQVVICPGNHDYYHPFSLYGLIEWPENVTIFQSGKLEEKDFPELGTVIYGVGWIKDTYNDCPFKEHLDLKEETNNILMLHGDAYDTTSDYMPLDISDYDYFDYVALGHIHKSDFMTNRVAYCGSPEPLSFKDEGDHGVIVGQVENHRCSAHFISTQNRKFITKTVAVDPDMTMDDLERVCLHVALDDERFKIITGSDWKGITIHPSPWTGSGKSWAIAFIIWKSTIRPWNRTSISTASWRIIRIMSSGGSSRKCGAERLGSHRQKSLVLRAGGDPA